MPMTMLRDCPSDALEVREHLARRSFTLDLCDPNKIEDFPDMASF